VRRRNGVSALLILLALALAAAAEDGSREALPTAKLVPAEQIAFPAAADSNSPAYWRDGDLHLLTSLNHPYHSVGDDLTTLRDPVGVIFTGGVRGPRWMESVLADEDGILFGYYHHEPSGLCGGVMKTAPEIGAARSSDGGYTWTDLGIILKAPDSSLECRSDNSYFVGGEGDFSAVLDRERRFVYFFFSSYAADTLTQGIGIARMAWGDREAPAGRVLKWRNREWSSPGVGGALSPLYSTRVSWHQMNADALWGPSVHWNAFLDRYVMLMTRAIDASAQWTTEGIYIAYAQRLEDSLDWSEPEKLLEGGAWYPQVIGLRPGAGTDSQAGRVARFFMSGVSHYLIEFERPAAGTDSRR
jgi:hypothetical protein